MSKKIKDLKDSISILEANIQLFYEGNTAVYKVIASQLRLLLCDGKNSLLPRIFDNIHFHPLLGYITKEEDGEWKKKHGRSMKDGLVFQMPAHIHFDGKGKSKILALFNERKKPLSLKEWLDQDLFNEKITIKQLIKSVADKESVHSDKEYDNTLKFTKSIKLIDEDIHIKFIVEIGAYLLKHLNLILSSIKQ